MNIEKLTSESANLIMTGAIEYCLKQGLTDAQISALGDRLCEEMKKVVPTALDEALNDAKEAFDSNMTDYASMTFFATMKLAGVNAAKTVLGVE